MQLVTPLLLLPSIFLPPAVTAWANFHLSANINYTTCHTQVYPNQSDQVCSIDKFPAEGLLSSLVGSTVHSSSYCCSESGYYTYGSCAGHGMEKYSNVPVCMEPGMALKAKKRKPECGDGCWAVTMEGVTFEELARMIREEKSGYCVSYYCDDGSNEWKLGLELCECNNVGKEIFETIKQEIKNTNLSSCCGENMIFNFESDKCESEGRAPHTFTGCGYKNKTKARFKRYADAEHEDHYYQCIGAVQGSDVGGIVCEPACNGSVPCVRSCCAEDELWNENHCSPTMKPLSLEGLFPRDGAALQLGMVEFSSWNVECPAGTENTQLYPAWSCYDRVVLGQEGDMVFKERGEQLPYGEFCFAKLNGSFLRGDVFIQACLPTKRDKTLLPFYSYVLAISIFCLFCTMVIYITSPELTNPTNKIMLNFTAALFVAYLVLVFIQRPEILEKQIGLSRLLCQTLGHVEQFSFLSAFTWISIMSFENLNQLKGLSQVNNLQTRSDVMKQQMLIGYGIPFAFCLLTTFVEMFAPECAIYKPRFGHRTCFFYGQFDKFLWFYLPIIIMLVINTFIFLYIMLNIHRVLNNNDPSRRMPNRQTRKRVEEGLLYTRLFVGMGLNWYLEIVGWAMLSDKEESMWQVIPDCVNMLQGVWVFLNFVCQRKVVRVIKKRQRSIFGTRETKSV